MGEALQDPEMVSSTLAAGCVHLAHELAFSPPVVVLRAAPGKSGLHARGEGERVLALESRAP